MRSEKEIRNWIDGINATLKVTCNDTNRIRLEGLKSALEWVLTETVEPQEPLDQIELRDLRAILAEHRKKSPSLGMKPGSNS